MKGLRNLCNKLLWLTQPGWRTVTSVWGSDKNISYTKTTLQLKKRNIRMWLSVNTRSCEYLRRKEAFLFHFFGDGSQRCTAPPQRDHWFVLKKTTQSEAHSLDWLTSRYLLLVEKIEDTLKNTKINLFEFRRKRDFQATYLWLKKEYACIERKGRCHISSLRARKQICAR